MMSSVPQPFTCHLKLKPELYNSKDPQSPAVSFLQDSCGLSLESAISASKKFNIENIENPNLVLHLLRNHGLTQTHIRNLISRRPLLLLADLDNTLKPNIDLFESLGFSGTNLAKMLCTHPRVLESDAHSVVQLFRAHGFSDKQISTMTMKRPKMFLSNAHDIFKPKLEFFKSMGLSDLEVAKLLSIAPYVLERSLENQIIPCVQELRRILGTDENVLLVTKSCYRILAESTVLHVPQANMSTLLSHGVPRPLVLKLFIIKPKLMLLSNNHFSEIVHEITRLGFNPNNLLFVLAIVSMVQNGKTLWEQKVEALRSFGLSKDEIYSAFKLQPMCMNSSEKKIKKLMDFFVNKLKMKPSMISKNPNLLLLSLERRIIPRCSVMQLLISKGLIKEDTSVVHMFKMTEKKFVEKLVSKYHNEVPNVISAHQGKIEFQGFLTDLKM
ncbi:hypothetical protein F2P56_003319 [Juglans regia]|uniref:Transcription termination factor MTERF6, chloroplastic/mitochondrial-like n=1 Tax=Juglans regia TaxID=51240 RepID=A0A833XSJ1_JUGRE|nr:hypothetical protein F2P56_003319 [Juglans regia]